MRLLSLLLIICNSFVFAQQENNPGQVLAESGISDSTIIIGSITIEGNKITHEKIIYREIEFRVGDKLSSSQLDSLITQSRQNLINRSLFNFVTINKTTIDRSTDIAVDVVERWYIWPIPIVNFADRNLNAWWESKDFGRLNYGVDLRVDNFRGRMEKLNIIVQGGFDQVLAAKWTIPYLTKNQFLGIAVGGGYQWNREVIVNTEENKPVYYEASSGYAQQKGFASIDLTLRPKYNFLHTLSLGFEHYQFQDTLLDINPDFTYGDTRYDFFSVSYLYKHDFRDYKPYPLIGYYFDVGIEKQGLGIVEKEVDIWTATFVFDQYLQLYKRWYFAYSVAAQFTDKEYLPYFLTPGIGYQGMEIRGYELYIINGQNFGIIKSNFKFEIFPRTTKRINWIKTEKFGKVFYALYANLFFDAAYASDHQNYQNNPLTNQLLWGTGVGIDFITYYDLVIRFEYTINKQGDQGFFINLVAPI